jgi:hypothetical protein
MTEVHLSEARHIVALIGVAGFLLFALWRARQ